MKTKKAISHGRSLITELKEFAGPVQLKVPSAVYHCEGDFVEFLAKAEPFFAERIDELVTAYYGQDSKELIGCTIKGIAKLRKNPAFALSLEDDKVELRIILLLHVNYLEDEAIQVKCYKRLYQLAKETEVKADLQHA